LPVETGQDKIYVFLDTNGEVPFGYKVNDEFYANQMIEITGKYGIVMKSAIYNYGSYDDLEKWEWILLDGVVAASGNSEIEFVAEDLPNQFRAHFHLVSWDEEIDDSEAIWIENGAELYRGSYNSKVTFDNDNPCNISGCTIRTAYDSTNDVFVIVWMKKHGNGQVRAGEIDSNGAITLGSTTYEWVDDENWVVFFDVAFDLEGSAGEESFVIMWRKEDAEPVSDNNHRAFSLVGTVDDSDLSISLGTATEIGTDDLAGHYMGATDMAGDNRILFCYGIQASDTNERQGGACKAGTVDGSAKSVSWGSQSCFTASCGNDADPNVKWNDVVDVGNNQFVLIWHDVADSRAQIRGGSIGASGTTVSWGTTVDATDDPVNYVDIAYDSGTSKFIAVWTAGDDGEYTVGSIDGSNDVSIQNQDCTNTCDQFETSDGVKHVGIDVRNSNEIVIIWEDHDPAPHAGGNGRLAECALSNGNTELSCTQQDDWDTGDVQRMSLLYLKDTFFLIAYRETDANPNVGLVMTYDSIPEFANIFMPVLSVLTIVGLKYRRK
jgi:hypothetical protein